MPRIVNHQFAYAQKGTFFFLGKLGKKLIGYSPPDYFVLLQFDFSTCDEELQRFGAGPRKNPSMFFLRSKLKTIAPDYIFVQQSAIFFFERRKYSSKKKFCIHQSLPEASPCVVVVIKLRQKISALRDESAVIC